VVERVAFQDYYFGPLEPSFQNGDNSMFIDNLVIDPDLGPFPTPTSEPATWAMMLIGLGGIGAAMRSARRKQLRPEVTV
jgi:hypothetical protein